MERELYLIGNFLLAFTLVVLAYQCGKWAFDLFVDGKGEKRGDFEIAAFGMQVKSGTIGLSFIGASVAASLSAWQVSPTKADFSNKQGPIFSQADPIWPPAEAPNFFDAFMTSEAYKETINADYFTARVHSLLSERNDINNLLFVGNDKDKIQLYRPKSVKNGYLLQAVDNQIILSYCNSNKSDNKSNDVDDNSIVQPTLSVFCDPEVLKFAKFSEISMDEYVNDLKTIENGNIEDKPKVFKKADGSIVIEVIADKKL